MTSSGGRQTPDNLNRRFRNILTRLEEGGKLTDTKSVHIHVLRRTYISHMIMSGADPATVMAIVGHQEWATIQRYLALAPAHVVATGAKLPY